MGLFELFRLLGAWPQGVARPIPPSSPLAHQWPAKALLGLAVLALLGWLTGQPAFYTALGVPTPVLTGALQARFASQGAATFAGKAQSALRKQFGGHAEMAPQ